MCPMPRAAAPTAWATAPHTVRTARSSAEKKRATGPGPERTARGAGRFADEEVEDLVVGFRALRERELDALLPAEARLEAVVLVEEVLLLREPGGEDVRVAMVVTLGPSHMRPMHHTSACRGLDPEPGGRRSRLQFATRCLWTFGPLAP